MRFGKIRNVKRFFNRTAKIRLSTSVGQHFSQTRIGNCQCYHHAITILTRFILEQQQRVEPSDRSVYTIDWDKLSTWHRHERGEPYISYKRVFELELNATPCDRSRQRCGGQERSFFYFQIGTPGCRQVGSNVHSLMSVEYYPRIRRILTHTVRRVSG